ncbi:MAG: D-fructose 1,6-bisphosphatase [Candidatus Lokiarchaeota archaeon]|nr:D-fructose 1,6-bisphosphatase [Candidatus Lokiarchaeota archaeon]
MGLSIDFLKLLATEIYKDVSPLLGTVKAGIKYERGAGGDISMHIDIVAEKALLRILNNNYIDILIISEEMGEKYIGSKEKAIESQKVLIVDPVDGSNNAVRGIPYSSISIAYAEGKAVKDIEKAVVLNLNTKDIYWAEKGKGAFLNEKKIHVSNLNLSDNCFFELNLPKKNAFTNIERLKPIIERFNRIRILGSSALTLCQVAKGSMEAFINLRESNRLVDVAAGLLILKEANGRFFSLDGSELDHRLSIDLKFPFIACNANLEPFLKREFIQK